MHQRVEAAGVGGRGDAVRAVALVLVGGHARGGAVPDQGGVAPAGQLGGELGIGVQRNDRIASASFVRARWIRPRTASSVAPVISEISA